MCTWGYSQNTTCNLESNNIYKLIKCWQIEDFWNFLCMLLKMLLSFREEKKNRVSIEWLCQECNYWPSYIKSLNVIWHTHKPQNIRQVKPHSTWRARFFIGRLYFQESFFSPPSNPRFLLSPLFLYNTETQIYTVISFRMHSS